MAKQTSSMTLLMATVDTLPRPYEVLTMLTVNVNAQMKMSLRNVNEMATEEAKRLLNEQAIAIGADAVIGIRFAFPYQGQVYVSGTAIKYR